MNPRQSSCLVSADLFQADCITFFSGRCSAKTDTTTRLRKLQQEKSRKPLRELAIMRRLILRLWLVWHMCQACETIFSHLLEQISFFGICPAFLSCTCYSSADYDQWSPNLATLDLFPSHVWFIWRFSSQPWSTSNSPVIVQPTLCRFSAPWRSTYQFSNSVLFGWSLFTRLSSLGSDAFGSKSVGFNTLNIRI